MLLCEVQHKMRRGVGAGKWGGEGMDGRGGQEGKEEGRGWGSEWGVVTTLRLGNTAGENYWSHVTPHATPLLVCSGLHPEPRFFFLSLSSSSPQSEKNGQALVRAKPVVIVASFC